MYLNNAGTSWPKPDAVASAVEAALTASPADAGPLLARGHAAVAETFRLPAAERFVFTTGCSAALQLAITSLAWRAGDVCLTSALEHHALIRPIVELARSASVEHDVLPRAADGPIDLDHAAERLAAGGVRLLAVSMASNVTGELLPIAELAELAHAHGAHVLVDAAQTAGALPIDVAALGADLFCFAGHKGPLGPLGVGGLWIGPGLRAGVEGARCDLDGPPCDDDPPLGYCDVGSANLPAIAGLTAGLAWLAEAGLDAVRSRLVELTGRTLAGLAAIDGVTVHGLSDPERRTAAISLTLAAMPAAAAERALAERHGIVARAGLHCAPHAHRALGTEQHGTLRLSYGPFSAPDDVDRLLAAIAELAR